MHYCFRNTLIVQQSFENIINIFTNGTKTLIFIVNFIMQKHQKFYF